MDIWIAILQSLQSFPYSSVYFSSALLLSSNYFFFLVRLTTKLENNCKNCKIASHPSKDIDFWLAICKWDCKDCKPDCKPLAEIDLLDLELVNIAVCRFLLLHTLP